tara:strand:- start:496 stop:840 length:345 start_codon:yes stop_codon:yes gene_type:complete
MIDTDKYEGHLMDKAVEDNSQVWVWKNWMLKNAETIEQHKATASLLNDAPLLLAEVKRLRGLLDEIDDVVYYNDKKAGQVLPVEKPNLELLRDIMMSYTDEAYQIRGDEGEWIE